MSQRRSQHRAIFFCVAIVIAVAGVDGNAQPAIPAAAPIAPSQVFARVATLADGLEHLRVYMGKPKPRDAALTVRNATLRNLFFQGAALFNKANQLAFELTAAKAPKHVIPDAEIYASDVLRAINDALDRLRHIRRHLGLAADRAPDLSTTLATTLATTPADVFRAMAQANRQLNILLTQKFSASDAYQQISRAIGYTFRLRGHMASSHMLEPPAFEPGKRPADVYRKLLRCLQRLRDIAKLSHVDMLDLTVRKADIEAAEPGDVYDLASLLVSELAYVHARFKVSQPPYNVYPPGLKFPAHAYQRAGLLEAQLIDLQTMAQRNPTWLQSKMARP